MNNDYAAGKKVYKGGLPNATSGTVNPTGYIKRESDKRSGLAALALAKMKGQTAGPGGVLPATKKTFNVAGIAVSPTGKLANLKGA